jgi:hypothetical protein
MHVSVLMYIIYTVYRLHVSATQAATFRVLYPHEGGHLQDAVPP